MYRSRSTWDSFIEHAALTDVGLRRPNNQDSYAVAKAPNRARWLERGHLFVVADGMGAHAAGELASKMATDVMALSYFKHREGPPSEALLAAVRDANEQIYRRGQSSLDFKGMGTTICALALTCQGAFVAHVGDSRAYRWRAHRLEQLTFDHSLRWEMRAAGHISADDSGSFIPRNIITRSLGPHPEVEVDMEGPFSVRAGDVFVLCSDGLSGPVEDDEIGKIVGCMSAEESARALVDLANLRGGSDNITVIVVRVLGEPEVPELLGDQPEEAEVEVRPPLNPLWLGLIGALGLGALILAAFGQWLLAAASLLLGGLAAGATWVYRASLRRRVPTYQGQPLGRGPYKAAACRPDRGFVEKLAQTVQELEEAASREDWKVDWSRFSRHRDRAKEAVRAGDWAGAVAEFCRAMSFMMGQLKTVRRRNHLDSKARDW